MARGCGEAAGPRGGCRSAPVGWVRLGWRAGPCCPRPPGGGLNPPGRASREFLFKNIRFFYTNRDARAIFFFKPSVFFQHSRSAGNVFFSKTSVFCDQKSPHQVCHKPYQFIYRSSFSFAGAHFHLPQVGFTGWRLDSLAGGRLHLPGPCGADRRSFSFAAAYFQLWGTCGHEWVPAPGADGKERKKTQPGAYRTGNSVFHNPTIRPQPMHNCSDQQEVRGASICDRFSSRRVGGERAHHWRSRPALTGRLDLEGDRTHNCNRRRCEQLH